MCGALQESADKKWGCAASEGKGSVNLRSGVTHFRRNAISFSVGAIDHDASLYRINFRSDCVHT